MDIAGDGKNCASKAWKILVSFAQILVPLTVFAVLAKTTQDFYRSKSETASFVDYPGLIRQHELTTIKMAPDMKLTKMDEVFYALVSRLHYVCKDWSRIGNQGDGGWNMCLVGPYRPQSPCLVYSFGINYDWSFDDAIVNDFGCTVRSFDPSMLKVNDHIRGSNIHFYRIGIAGKNGVLSNGWNVKTLSSLVTQLNDTNKNIDYLKIDVDGSEWSAFESFFGDPIVADILEFHVKQFGLEIHFGVRFPFRTAPPRELYSIWLTLTEFEKRYSFRRWWFSPNPFTKYTFGPTSANRSRCYEMVYINRRFLSADNAAAQISL